MTKRILAFALAVVMMFSATRCAQEKQSYIQDDHGNRLKE